MRRSAIAAIAWLFMSGVALAQPATSTNITRPPATTTAPSTAGQYASESEAKSKCASDPVVWMNLDSHIYHYAGAKNYGNTKKGAYMCKAEADRTGRVAKNEKPKATAH